jgi:hypothetical protein
MFGGKKFAREELHFSYSSSNGSIIFIISFSKIIFRKNNYLLILAGKICQAIAL